MKYSLSAAVFAAAFFVAASTASASTSWQLNTPANLVFSCGVGSYAHTLDTVSQNMETGEFSGTGHWNTNASYTWDVTGTIDGDAILFTVVYTGANAGYMLNLNGSIATDGTASGSSDGNCQSFTLSGLTFLRTAEITSPEAGDVVIGDVLFAATLTDKDGNDNVQWAVRKGTCAAGVGTVFGNVDGYSDGYTWDGSSFSAQTDTTGWELGAYCFVFNPSESAGDAAIRLTREFNLIDPDLDDDGVMNDDDLCPSTLVPDVFPGFTDKQAKNRWMMDGSYNWITNGKPGTQGDFNPTIQYTHGCSGIQILDRMSEATGEDFGGHYKYGLSKSILEDWHEGRYYLGRTFVETVEVPADSSSPVSSIATLESGTDYFLMAYGTANAGDSIEFDSDYSFRSISSTEWTDAVSTYESYGDTLLDLFVDGASLNWGPYAASHEYEVAYPGTGNTLELKVYDVYYPNNVGNLYVDIIEDKWVELW